MKMVGYGMKNFVEIYVLAVRKRLKKNVENSLEIWAQWQFGDDIMENMILEHCRNKEYSYSDFLQTKITSEAYGTAGSFLEEDGLVYITTEDGLKIPFPMLYKEELHKYLLIAAEQRLTICLKQQEARNASQLLQKGEQV